MATTRPDPDLVAIRSGTGYLENALSRAHHARFEEHLAGCEGCTAYLAELRRALQVLGGLREVPVPDHLREELLAAFGDWMSIRV